MERIFLPLFKTAQFFRHIFFRSKIVVHSSVSSPVPLCVSVAEDGKDHCGVCSVFAKGVLSPTHMRTEIKEKL